MIRLMALSLVLAASAVSAQTGTLHCNTSGNLAYVTETLSMTCSTFPCTSSTQTYTFPVGSCDLATGFSDAQVILSGWKWNSSRSAHRLHTFQIHVASNSFNSSTQTISYTIGADVQLDSALSDTGSVTVNVQIIAVRPRDVIVRESQSCTNSDFGSCDSTVQYSPGISSGAVFGGFGLTGFKLVADTNGAGTNVNHVGVDVSNWVQDGSLITLTQTCALTGSTPPAGMSCDVDVAGIAGAGPDLAAYSAGVAAPNQTTPKTWPFNFVFPPPNAMLCGEEAFDLTFPNGSSNPVWQMWGGASATDCGKSPGGYSGSTFNDLGDAYNQANTNAYTETNTLLGTKLR